MIRNRIWLTAALALFAAARVQPAVWAQSDTSTKAQEDDELREELQRIIKDDPEHAAEAQKALDALNQPETSREGRQARNRREQGARRIVNGLPSRSHPAVGALVRGSTPQTARALCTGTLVGCDKFLTAAHCIAEKPAPDGYLVFFQELGFFKVKNIRWEKEKFHSPDYDLAMLTLAKPVEGIAPVPLNTSVKPLNKSIATIAGFGRTGGTRQDYGIKREGSVKLAACPAEWSSRKVLCWNFDADVKPRASAQNTCNADSGGGIFLRDNEGARIVEKLFGVVTGGTDANCMNNDLSYNVDVLQYREWIQTAGEGRLSANMCGRPAQDGAHQPVRQVFHLDAGKAKASFTLGVPEGSPALRVAMNGEDNGFGRNEYRLAVFNSEQTADACDGKGNGIFAFCAVDKPKPGAWTVTVTRVKGEGEVQITAAAVRPGY